MEQGWREIRPYSSFNLFRVHFEVARDMTAEKKQAQMLRL